MKESRHERFERLACARGTRVIREIRLIGNLSNTKNYQYTDEDVEALFSAIEDELAACKRLFRDGGAVRLRRD